MDQIVRLTVDGHERDAEVDTRTSLLDTLRDHLGVTAPKKGCDHGQCGACTVLLDGRRMLSCLTFAVANDGAEVVTAEGLSESALHPVQQAFVDHDALQCGFCTPGQVCSAVGMLDEAGDPVRLTDAEIREQMSGNLCRCGAYVNIVAAIREVADRS
ncbi:MAG TPA: (2Fe-2S)-binding protein [Nocardioidaceae bacterium]|nr:(2Fe-2S)-binding protein [Nocardioidaceae bacterium]